MWFYTILRNYLVCGFPVSNYFWLKLTKNSSVWKIENILWWVFYFCSNSLCLLEFGINSALFFIIKDINKLGSRSLVDTRFNFAQRFVLIVLSFLQKYPMEEQSLIIIDVLSRAFLFSSCLGITSSNLLYISCIANFVELRNR